MTALPLDGSQQQAPPPEPSFDFKTPQLRRRWEKLKVVMAENEATLKELQAKARKYGGEFVIQPQQMEQLKIAALIDVLLPGNTEEGQNRRLDIDFKVHERLKGMLAQAMEEVGKVALQAGSMLPPDQMAALMRQAPGLAQPQERRRR